MTHEIGAGGVEQFCVTTLYQTQRNDEGLSTEVADLCLRTLAEQMLKSSLPTPHPKIIPHNILKRCGYLERRISSKVLGEEQRKQNKTPKGRT